MGGRSRNFLFVLFILLIALFTSFYSFHQSLHVLQERLFALRFCALFEPVEDSLTRYRVLIIEELTDLWEEWDESG